MRKSVYLLQSGIKLNINDDRSFKNTYAGFDTCTSYNPLNSTKILNKSQSNNT